MGSAISSCVKLPTRVDRADQRDGDAEVLREEREGRRDDAEDDVREEDDDAERRDRAPDAPYFLSVRRRRHRRAPSHLAHSRTDGAREARGEEARYARPVGRADARVAERLGEHLVRLRRGGEGVEVRAGLHHQADLDGDVVVPARAIHRLQVADVVHLALAGDQELVVRRDAALVLDVRVDAVRRELRDDRLHIHALHIEVADVEVDAEGRAS